jgi:hypothetical protein
MRKYTLYAIGEIAMVVIGILIALQVNNWNEDRKTLLSQVQLLTKLSEEITQDISRFRNQHCIYLLWEAQADNIISNVLSSRKSRMIVHEYLIGQGNLNYIYTGTATYEEMVKS